MSAWTKFATNFFHQKQKQNPDFKFSQALKQASPLFKKMKKGGSSKKQRGGEGEKYKISDVGQKELCSELIDGAPNPEYTNPEICKSSEEIDLALKVPNNQNANMKTDTNDAALDTNDNTIDLNANDNGMTDANEMKTDANEMKTDADGNTNTDTNGNTNTDTNGNGEGGSKGGRKSRRKSKKAGKKSQKKQKKAKKAGSKKSKK